jgi:hypothetical protein
MEGKKEKPETTPPRVARVLKLLDEPEDPEELEVPQLKRRKLVKASDKEPALDALAKKSKSGFVALLAVRRKIGLKPMIRPMAAYEALLFDEPIAVRPLAEVLLPPTNVVPLTTIPVDLASTRLSGPNIQHIFEDIEMELEDSTARARARGGP